jgi:hypothetical protein
MVMENLDDAMRQPHIDLASDQPVRNRVEGLVGC